MPMMSDYEEDLDDFEAECIDRLAASLVGAYRAESTDQWTAGSGNHYEDSTTLWWANVLVQV